MLINLFVSQSVATLGELIINMIKEILKKIIPPSIRFMIRQFEFRLFRVDKNYKNLSNSEIFNLIYNEGLWGKNEYGESTSGRGSHADEIIQPYISEISKFLLDIKPSILVDLGCGDFNVGKNFVNFCEKYIACDVSSEILNRNKENFSKLKNVDFNLLDLTSDQLPKGDVCFVRQVLQHLTNNDIKEFVEKLNHQKPYKYLVLTEHLPLDDNFKPNIDINSGDSIRLFLKSGVVLHSKPFNLNYLEISDLLEVNEIDGRIKTTIYKF